MQTMTMELGSNRNVQTPCAYKIGDTITLAQLGEEKIECKVKSLLGEGATATVFKVVTTANGDTRALKVFKMENSCAELCKEASLVLTANFPRSHPNVMQADFGWFEQGTREMSFLLGLVDGGDLRGWMDDERLYSGTAAEQQGRIVGVADRLLVGCSTSTTWPSSTRTSNPTTL